MKLYKYIVLLSWIVVIVACEDRSLSYTGPTVVEFSNPVTGYNEKLTGQSIGGTSTSGGNENISIRGAQDSVLIQLVGQQLSEPVEVSYEIIPGTAVAGEDYAIVGTEGVVTIPANSSTAAIHFDLLNTSEDPTDIRTLTFELKSTDNSDVSISANYKVYEVSIFPMKAYLDVTLGDEGKYFSSQTGEVYSSPGDAPVLVDIAYKVSDDGTETPMLVSPNSISSGASETYYSSRVFAPSTSLPENLQASYATSQLSSVNSTSVEAIPTAGTTEGAAVHSEVQIVANGIYSFVNGNGKKGYIRIKSISNSSVTLDIMAQP